MKNENCFALIVPMYNASKTLGRMLHSIFGQSYENWRVVLIDDVSNEDELEKCEDIIGKFANFYDGLIFEKKFTFIKNDTKRWETYNVLNGIMQCQSDDIICRLDADDYLCDLDALSFLNEAYEKSGFKAIWTAHRWNCTDRNISGNMPPDADPYFWNWSASHLKSFRKSLIENVAYENFLNQNGELVQRAGDQSLYLPVLRNAGRLRGFLPRVLYHYTISENGGAVYQTDDAKFQKAEADFIRNRGYVVDGTPWEKFFTG